MSFIAHLHSGSLKPKLRGGTIPLSPSSLGSLEPAAGLTCGSQRQSRGGRHEERREDQLTPVRYHEFFRDQLPNCRLEVIPDSGHWPYAEQPEIFDRAVSGFLDTRSLII